MILCRVSFTRVDMTYAYSMINLHQMRRRAWTGVPSCPLCIRKWYGRRQTLVGVVVTEFGESGDRTRSTWTEKANGEPLWVEGQLGLLQIVADRKPFSAGFPAGVWPRIDGGPVLHGVSGRCCARGFSSFEGPNCENNYVAGTTSIHWIRFRFWKYFITVLHLSFIKWPLPAFLSGTEYLDSDHI